VSFCHFNETNIFANGQIIKGLQIFIFYLYSKRYYPVIVFNLNQASYYAVNEQWKIQVEALIVGLMWDALIISKIGTREPPHNFTNIRPMGKRVGHRAYTPLNFCNWKQWIGYPLDPNSWIVGEKWFAPTRMTISAIEDHLWRAWTSGAGNFFNIWLDILTGAVKFEAILSTPARLVRVVYNANTLNKIKISVLLK